MGIIERLISLITPFECINCSSEGELLCKLCQQNLEPAPKRQISEITGVYAVASYKNMAKDLIWRLKYQNNRQAAKLIAELISQALPLCHDFDFIIPAPTSAKRARRRGYDQAKLIARHVSKQTSIPYKDALVRLGSSSNQVGATRRARQNQIKGVFGVKPSINLENINILLIDDVSTTGSTLQEAAETLKNYGAKQVSVAVFALA